MGMIGLSDTERLILENQNAIMRYLLSGNDDKMLSQWIKTTKILKETTEE